MIFFPFYLLWGQQISQRFCKDSLTLLSVHSMAMPPLSQVDKIYQNRFLYNQYLKYKETDYNIKNNYYINYPFYDKHTIYNPLGIAKANDFWIGGLINLLSEKLISDNHSL